jgi:hypothetical protein
VAIKIEQSVMLDHPTVKVFALVSDPENWGWLRPGPQEKGQVSLEQVGVGAEFQPTLDVQGQVVELLCEVTDYAPDELLSFACVRENTWIMVDLVIEPVNEGTKLTCKMEGNIRGFVNNLLEPFISQEINEQVKASLESLKGLLDSSSDCASVYPHPSRLLSWCRQPKEAPVRAPRGVPLSRLRRVRISR